MLGNERRHFTRVVVRMQITVSHGEAGLIARELQDISMGGAFIVNGTPLPVGTACVLSLEVSGPSSVLQIELEGEVIRTDGTGMAIRFTKIDLDSFLHLRHLVKLFSRDPETIDAELQKTFA
ncbi:MAG: PilZ domain-containing protein [Thermodesulfobacteriota bacterium]